MQVRTGTVTVTSNSPTVTGDGTSWLNTVLPGAMFLVRGDATPYYVAQVVSNTQLTLSAPFQGSTRGNAFYWISTSFTPNRNYPIPEAGDVDPALILARAIAEIDADIGTGGIGGGGASKLGQLSDVSETGVTTGDVLTRLDGGGYGFAPAGTALINGSNLGAGAAFFAGKVGNSLTYKSLVVQGGNVTVTPNEINLVIPPPGETNTASNVGSQSALSLFRRKFGVNLEFNGVRAGSGMAIVVDGNDLVFSSTVTGGTGGEANNGANLGNGNVGLFKVKSGISLGFRTLFLDPAHFTTTLSADGNVYSIVPVAKNLDSLTDVESATAVAGQFLRKDSDGNWKGATIPAPGIASLAADLNPTLGGNLNLNSKSVIGLRGGYSALLEEPIVKTYILDINCPDARTLTSLSVFCQTGSVSFEVRVGDVLIAGLQGQVSSGSVLTLSPTNTAPVPLGSVVQFRVTAVGVDTTDFCFTLAYQSA